MKKNLLASVFLIITLAGCKKDTDENFHVSFSVNGANKSYKGHVFAHKETVSGFSQLVVNGSTSATSYNDYMGIYLDNYPAGNNFSTGEYTDAGTTYSLLSTYANGGSEYEAGQSIAEDAVSYGVTITNHFKINITQLDAETIRGTFSGDFYPGGNVRSTGKITITNGEFYAKFQ
ncbi:MAG: hypothetical protein IPH18_07925 [Chitinophagaceae bacterium]|nr:hypothetical protein [Chitinophagaceae bacterium]MBK8953412.1 hypothetical protein [Chitinophagaceae bacterium]